MIAQRVPVETGQPTAHALRPGYCCSARDCLCGSKSRRAAETDCVAGVVGLELGNVFFCNLGRTPWVYRAFSYQRLFADAGKRPIQIAPG
jgi:hypothetical protein